jgi:ribosomal protein L16 Arg81 hydroxylase
MYDQSVDETFPGFKRAEKVSISLSAGSILYIPPFWHVHTEEMSLNGVSFGVDVLSISEQQRLLMEAYSTSLPLRGDKFSLDKSEHKVIGTMVIV